jgi:3-phenylpropionate/trans-cinnamate dioxygenase ferredoxin subunit
MAFREVCAADELPAGSRKIVEAGRTSIGVFNVNGRLYAVRNVCPHHGAELCRGEIGGAMLPSEVGEYRYGMDGQILRCPRHAWQFDLETGKSIHQPDRHRCRVYAVKVEDGHVLVDL